METGITGHHCFKTSPFVMIKFSFLFYILIFLLPSGLFACSCASELVVNNFQKSQFVAKAKLIKITPDPANEDYHDAEIQIIELYKGEHLAKIKIASLRNTSCSSCPRKTPPGSSLPQCGRENSVLGCVQAVCALMNLLTQSSTQMLQRTMPGP